MAASLLSAVEPIIKGKAFEDLCTASFPVSGHIPVETARAGLQSAQELLSNDGIPLSSLKKSELNGFIKDASTAEPGSFTLAEYQALLETVTKYAALKARHNNGKRWGLGLSLSTAGAMALTAAVFTSASMMLVAVPAGAAVGAVAVAADGSRGRRRDRRTAKQGSSSKSPAAAPSKAAAPAEEPAPAADGAVGAAAAPLMVEDSVLDIAPAGADEEAVVMASPTAAAAAAPATAAALEEPVKESPAAVAAAPAAAAAAAVAVAVAPPAVPAPAAPTPAPVGSGNSSPRGSSEELVSAVVDFMPAAEPAAADSKPASHPTVDVDSGAATGSADDDSASLADVPAPVQCDSPFSAAARDTTAAPAFASSELPADALLMPPAVRTSTGSDLPSSTSAAAGAVPSAPAASVGLPPKPKKSKSLTKSMSKKIKKAFSLKDKDTVSSSSADAGAHRALDADSADGSPLAPPVPPVRKSGSFFRRSSDGGSFLRRSTDGSGSGGSSFFRRSSSDMGAADADSIDGGVERSKGSATIKKMVDGIRRSFSLERPSLELLAPKRARKDKAAAAAL